MIDLVAVTPRDYETLIRWAESPRLLFQWTGGSLQYPLTEEQLHAHFTAETPLRHCFKAVFSDTGEMMGYCDLNIDPRNDSASIGRVIVGPEFRGRGAGVAMMKAVIRQGFEGHALHRITLHVFDFNEHAIRAYRKAGFQSEGLLREAYKYEGEYWNAVSMSILSNEWNGGRL